MKQDLPETETSKPATYNLQKATEALARLDVRPVLLLTMVQIRQKDLKKRAAIRQGVLGLLRFVLVSAMVPLLFVGRVWYYNNNDSSNNQKQQTMKPTENSLKGESEKSSVSETKDTVVVAVEPEAKLDDDQLHFQLDDSDMFNVLDNLDWSDRLLLGSDIVELYHCDVDTALLQHRANFTVWAAPILTPVLTAILEKKLVTTEETDKLQTEFALELLEMYLTTLVDTEYCDFSSYTPSVPTTVAAEVSIDAHPSTDATRLVFSIIAFQDYSMLAQLIEAIHLPQHAILIHLDKHADPDFVTQVHGLSDEYANVHVLQFGTILYQTDSVSMINYRIMRWLTVDLDLAFDYLVTMDAASYPLFNAERLLRQLEESKHQVYLGETYRNGQPVRVTQVAHLRQKRLWYTVGSTAQKPFNRRLPRTLFSDESIPESIRNVMQYKTNSGNQAVYTRSVVQQLVESVQVRQLMSLSKYGCCCCLEELNWVAALQLINIPLSDILQTSGTLQVWGGASKCGSSMKNALISEAPEQCFRLEDSTLLRTLDASLVTDDMYFWSNSTWQVLEHARSSGMLFARKFRSNSSSALLEKIRAEWHSDF